MPIQDSIFSIRTEQEFRQLALCVFRFQADNNPVYQSFISHLQIDKNEIAQLDQIPFLPISLFKRQSIIVSKEIKQNKEPSIFYSSGTSDTGRSVHKVVDLSLYEKSFIKGFSRVFGSPKDYSILALLPSYLEQKNSSLIYMVQKLISESENSESKFYLNDTKKLANTIRYLNEKGKKTLLFGVTYALLDFVEEFQFSSSDLIVMETGGMKGRRKEILRKEVHKILKKGFGVDRIYSEYGMTECLSQAYSLGEGIFQSPPWMRVEIRELEDPMAFLKTNQKGGVNIIDLANLYSCSFIATDDLGKKTKKNEFEILGRIDHSEARGCNLILHPV